MAPTGKRKPVFHLLQVADDAVLVLGNGDDAAAKFLAAESILGGQVALNCLEKADVRVPSAPVIVRASGC